MNSLQIPLKGLSTSNLTDKQKERLTELCRNAAERFLQDPEWEKNEVLRIVERFTPLDLSETQLEELIKLCGEELEICRLATDYDDNLFKIIENWLNDHDLILKEEEVEPELCQYQFPHSSQKCMKPVIGAGKFCTVCRSKQYAVSSEEEKEEEYTVLDAVVVDESKGLYRETKYNILLKQGRWCFKALGALKDITSKDLQTRPLSPEEKIYCKDLGIVVCDDNDIKQTKQTK